MKKFKYINNNSEDTGLRNLDTLLFSKVLFSYLIFLNSKASHEII